MKYYSYILFFLTINQAVALETVLFQYEKNVDHEIIDVVGENKKSRDLIVVAKSYLSKRKAKVDPKRSAYEVYEIVEAGRMNKTLLLKVLAEENIYIGKSAWVSDGFIIPVVRGDGLLEGYKYMPETGKIGKAFTNAEARNNGAVNSVYALSRGYIVVTSSGANIFVSYYLYDSKNNSSIRLLEKESGITTVSDVIERNNIIYMTGVSVINNDTYTWVYSFPSNGQEVNRKFFTLKGHKEKSNENIVVSKFIPSLGSVPSVFLSQRSSDLKETPEVEIIRISDKSRSVWGKKTSSIHGDKNIFVSEICNEQFIVIEKVTEQKPFVQKFNFMLINKDGSEKKMDIVTKYNAEIVLDLMLYPKGDFLYGLANFSKFENTRRPDGWYSWYGYRIDKYGVDSKCMIR